MPAAGHQESSFRPSSDAVGVPVSRTQAFLPTQPRYALLNLLFQLLILAGGCHAEPPQEAAAGHAAGRWMGGDGRRPKGGRGTVHRPPGGGIGRGTRRSWRRGYAKAVTSRRSIGRCQPPFTCESARWSSTSVETGNRFSSSITHVREFPSEDSIARIAADVLANRDFDERARSRRA